MATAYVSVGSNIEPERNVLEAVRRLAATESVTGVSTVYRTKAIGRPGDPDFINCVIRLETNLSAFALRELVLVSIEKVLGRRRSADRYAPRTIDLDLILYEDLVIDSPCLRLPDPDILRRPFLVLGLYELAPGLTLPGSGASIALSAAAAHRTRLRPLAEYTIALRDKTLHASEVGAGARRS
jgi:2-amino-4-hydroxy-6-hydroxymethyldihydropteridine diphosphokinase